jgi:muramoyltetrapeptide carboxypeptidase
MIKESHIIDVVFPATSVTTKEILQIKNYLKNLGLKPRILLEKQTTPRKNPNCSLANFSAKARFDQLYQALSSNDSAIVWCGRGGYSSGDLLPFLAKAKPIKQNKIFIGFSDITSISVFLQQNWGWKTACAPVLMQLIENGKLPVNKKSEKEILDFIFGRKTEFEYDLLRLTPHCHPDESRDPQLQPSSLKMDPDFCRDDVAKSNIKTEITGGCLSVLSGHFGGDFQIDVADKILFLEDVGEDGEKLDRYFRQIIEVILNAGKKPQAILLGEFCYGIKDKFTKQNIETAIQNLITRIAEFKLEIPVFKAKDALGHSDKMRTLILGAKSEIDVKKLSLKITR